MNVLSENKQQSVLLLKEGGHSNREIQRRTGVHRDTIGRLLRGRPPMVISLSQEMHIRCLDEEGLSHRAIEIETGISRSTIDRFFIRLRLREEIITAVIMMNQAVICNPANDEKWDIANERLWDAVKALDKIGGGPVLAARTV